MSAHESNVTYAARLAVEGAAGGLVVVGDGAGGGAGGGALVSFTFGAATMTPRGKPSSSSAVLSLSSL